MDAYGFEDSIPGIPTFRVISSPNANRSRAGQVPTVLMLHCTDGSGDEVSVGNLFASPKRQASSTFTIGRQGGVAQHVPIDWTAWDAGGGHLPSDAELERALQTGQPIAHDPTRHGTPRINTRTVSIELCNRAMLSDETAAALGPDRVFRGRSRNPASRELDWEAYPALLLGALTTMIGWLCVRVPTLRWWTCHEDVFSIFMPGGVTKTRSGRELGSKLDPGPAFDAVAGALPFGSNGLHRVRYEHKARRWAVDRGGK